VSQKFCTFVFLQFKHFSFDNENIFLFYYGGSRCSADLQLLTCSEPLSETCNTRERQTGKADWLTVIVSFLY